MVKNLISVMLRLLALLVVVLLLWSARFRFDHIIVEGETYLVRVHRVTGDADILIPGEGWVPAEDAWSDSSVTPPTSAGPGLDGRRTPPPLIVLRRGERISAGGCDAVRPMDHARRGAHGWPGAG